MTIIPHQHMYIHTTILHHYSHYTTHTTQHIKLIYCFIQTQHQHGVLRSLSMLELCSIYYILYYIYYYILPRKRYKKYICCYCTTV